MEDNGLPIQVYIENAADSAIGGFTIPLPTTKETLTPWLTAIGVDSGDPKGIEVKEIKGPQTLMAALCHGDHSLEELNYLAVKISGIGDYGEEMFLAALETGRFDGDITEIINLTENLNHYDLYPIYSEEQYGEFSLETDKDTTASAFTRLEKSEDPDDRALVAYILRLEAHIDADAYGCSMVEQERGVFTELGYLVSGDETEDIYRGSQDIPKEHRLFNVAEAPAVSIGPAPHEKTEIHSPFEKESVIAKIRAAKATAKTAPRRSMARSSSFTVMTAAPPPLNFLAALHATYL